ncbi:MAG: helix-turn-helix domain-containing protein [Prevotella sp.]|nr:helix-turn-helix domain-containing protein [Prevotella sp.]
MNYEEPETGTTGHNDYHRMGRRGHQKNYCWPGIYHITITVDNRKRQPLGVITGDASKSDGHPDAPKVQLSAIGSMVEQELLTSIGKHYKMVEVQDYVIMPDHLHFIIEVHSTIISQNGRVTHLGQVIAGFKKGCNRRYWELTGQADGQKYGRGKPADASNAPQGAAPQGAAPQRPAPQGPAPQRPAPQGAAPPHDSRPAVYPQGSKVPSRGSSGRAPLFAGGYVDVMPLEEGQLERQRQYIHNNPRNRLLRMSHRDSLSIHRGSINTALTPSALKGYLQRECGPFLFNDDIWNDIKNRLLITNAPADNNTLERSSTPADSNTPERSSTPRGFITCDSYGDSRLLDGHLLPVVCHRKDKALHAQQKERCLAAADKGAVLVSARIAEGERDIINTAIDEGFPVVTIEDNGLAKRYHPSEQRSNRCANGQMLIASPWKYAYRHADDGISVAECKTMNCIVQAICRTKDSWWKAAAALSVCILMLCSCQKNGWQTRDSLFQTIDLGKTPLELMHSMRIKRGRQLLEAGGGNVSQVTWQVGLSPKQFAKYFREEYGVLPSELNKK